VNVHIEKAGAGLNIRIEGTAGREQLVLERIRSCRQTAWACPSGECMNIATMQEQAGDGWVSLTLAPRPGGELSAAGIEECLRYMLQLPSR